MGDSRKEARMATNGGNPTRNVIALVKAETKRQDDLRNQDIKNIRRELKNLKGYLKAIAKAETKRIDAIRAVDVGAVAVANTAAENRATTLAGQVNAAKDAQVVSMKAETDPIRKDIGDLRQSQWTIAGGKQEVTEQETSTNVAANNKGMWIAIGVSALAFVTTSFISLIGIAVLLYVNKP
jgi:hypothetical protein